MGILSSYPGGSKSLLIFSGKIDEMGIADYYSFGKIRPGFQPIEVYNLPRIWIDWNSLSAWREFPLIRMHPGLDVVKEKWSGILWYTWQIDELETQ